jgi:hypothetical protein
MKNENTDKKGTCVYKKDIHESQKGRALRPVKTG